MNPFHPLILQWIWNITLIPKKHAPWTNKLVEVRSKNFGTHVRMFLHDTPETWCAQVRFLSYAILTQPISYPHFSPHEIVFHTKPHIPLKFQLKLPGIEFCEFTAQYYSGFAPQSHYQLIDSSPLLHSIIFKSFSIWFFAIKTAMLQIYLKVYKNALMEKILLHIQGETKYTQLWETNTAEFNCLIAEFSFDFLQSFWLPVIGIIKIEIRFDFKLGHFLLSRSLSVSVTETRQHAEFIPHWYRNLVPELRFSSVRVTSNF